MSVLKNSHFLLNTLNCIARTAYAEGARSTEEAIYSLSELVRSTLAETEQIQTIRGELEIVRMYLSLQKIRLKDYFGFQVDVLEQVMDQRIPNMTLLPIVEHAVTCGISNDDGMLRIRIYAKRLGRRIEIYVENNAGSGKENGSDHYILDKKLKRTFGEEYGIRTARSEMGKGSVTVVAIPVYERYA